MSNEEMAIRDQVKLIRSVIGRKIMEIDDYEYKAQEATGDEADKYLNMIDFLNNDIAGYKTIVDDLKDGSNDLTGNLWDIASLPEDSVSLYTDFYLTQLMEEDLEEEKTAMELKGKYAVDLARAYLVHVGRMALLDANIVELIIANEELSAYIGAALVDMPEVMQTLNKA